MTSVVGASANVVLVVDNVLYLAYTGWAPWQSHAGRVRRLPLRVFGALLGASVFSAALNVVLSIVSPPA